jgi:HK97 family phage portal protein
LGFGDKALAQLFGGRQVDAGVVVNESTALTYSAFWSAVTLISSPLASVPLHLYKRTGEDARERARGHPLDRLFSIETSPELGAFAFRRAMQMNVLINGNAYAEVQRMRASRLPSALHLIEPSRVAVDRDPTTQRLRYRVANPSGREVVLDPADMLHLAGPSLDGLTGMSIVGLARQGIGLGLATEKFGNRFFGAGARMGGILTTPARLSLEARRNLRESVNREHGGVDRSCRMLLLEEGLSYTPTSIPPEDAQFLQTRVHQVVEIARWFGIPPTMLGAAGEGGSLVYRNQQEETQRFVDLCLGPWSICWEQELRRKLIAAAERDAFYFRHTFAGLLRGDLPTRYASYKTGADGGWLSVNDIRKLEDLNPIEGGDVYGRPAAPTPAPGDNPGRSDHLSLLAGRRLIEDAARRSILRESDRARRATTIAALQTWATTYYGAAEANGLAGQLEPALAAITTVNDPAALAREIAAEWYAQSLRELRALAHAAPLDVKAAIQTLTDAWAQHRPRAIADAVLARIGSRKETS